MTYLTPPHCLNMTTKQPEPPVFKHGAPLAEARGAAHRAFDRLWINEREEGGAYMTRGQAYRWLRKALGKTREECHFGQFCIETCQKAEALAREKLDVLNRQNARKQRYLSRPDGKRN